MSFERSTPQWQFDGMTGAGGSPQRIRAASRKARSSGLLSPVGKSAIGMPTWHLLEDKPYVEEKRNSISASAACFVYWCSGYQVLHEFEGRAGARRQKVGSVSW